MLNYVLKPAKEIQTQLREYNALKLTLNVNFIFRFENNTQHAIDIYTANTTLFTSDMNEIIKQLNHHINEAREKISNKDVEKRAGLQF